MWECYNKSKKCWWQKPGIILAKYQILNISWSNDSRSIEYPTVIDKNNCTLFENNNLALTGLYVDVNTKVLKIYCGKHAIINQSSNQAIVCI